MSSIDDLFARIGAARSPARLWTAMVRHSQSLGFGAIGYLLFDKGRTGKALAMQHHGFSAQVVQTYAELGNGLHDPTLRVAFSTGKPWTIKEAAARLSLSSGEQHYRSIFNSIYAMNGIGLPLFGPNGRDAYVIMGAPEREALLDEIDRTAIHMAAQAAHLRALQLRSQSGEGARFSEREIEILRWIAQGKSNGVIASILEIAPATVDTHLRRIFDKLGVKDRTSAAVKGVSMGLIRI